MGNASPYTKLSEIPKHTMKRLFLLFAFALPAAFAPVGAQTLSLDSCRTLALRGNKALSIGESQMAKAGYDRKAARTNYLPKVALTAGYVRTSDELSLLSDGQKDALTSMGTGLAGDFGQLAAQIVQRHPELAPLVGQASGYAGQLAGALNGVGQGLVDALRTDTRNMTAGAVILTQPLYMGGKIRAYDRITRYAEAVVGQQLRAGRQEVVLETDRAYWQVVSLAGKRRLALAYRDMLQRLDDDVRRMVNEGVATKASALTVSVKLNEAELALAKVEDGLTLSRMLLCQTCGLPLDAPVRTADEEADTLGDVPPSAAVADSAGDAAAAFADRPELCQLQTAVGIYDEKVKVERAAFLPQLALMGGYMTTNPGLTNGFENRFRGTWAVGVTLKVPVWNWGEGRYKVRAARAEADVATLRMEEAREKVELQVRQSALRMAEADRKLGLSRRNCAKAEENLRTAQVGFREGVIPTSDLLAAQTAWLQAGSDRLDAQIDVRLSRSMYARALGTLGE